MSWGNPSRRRSKRDEDDEFSFPFNLGDIDRLIENMLRTARTLGKENGPIYYGYAVTTGPDGKPQAALDVKSDQRSRGVRIRVD